MAGYLLTMVMPLIPDEGRTKQISGAVVMHVIIGRDGHVRSAEPISGPNLLRQPYLDAVRQWTYRPYMLNGQPVEVESTVVLNPQINATPAPQASH